MVMQTHTYLDKIKTLDEILTELQILRSDNPHIEIVTTNGVFDIMHCGHVYMLNEAAKQGNVLIVGVNTDAYVKRVKGNDRPLFDITNRMQVVAAAGCVDYVFSFNEDDPREFISKIQPTVHVKSKSGYKGLEAESLNKYGGRLHLVDDVNNISTSGMLEAMNNFMKEMTERGGLI